MFSPLISIIIPVYNGSKYLKEAINSALAQTYQNIEVIIVNDGSTDDSEEIAKSYGNRVRYFKKGNGGVSTALNLGIKEAKGEYVSWLSHDDVYEINKIETQVKALANLSQEKQDETILFSNYRIINDQSKIIETCPIHLVHDVRKFSCHLYPIVKGLIFGCTLLIPKRCFLEQGFFDPELRTSQDYEMWLRLFPKYDLFFQADYLFLSRRHAEQGTYSKRAYDESNAFWINLMKKISDQDKIQIDGSLGNFYFLLSKQMSRVGYHEAAKYAGQQFELINEPLFTRIKYSLAFACQPFFSKIRRVLSKLS